MRISVKVKPGSKTESIEKLSNGQLHVRIKAPAKDGKANDALVKALSAYFNIPRSGISIVSGFGSKNKIIEL